MDIDMSKLDISSKVKRFENKYGKQFEDVESYRRKHFKHSSMKYLSEGDKAALGQELEQYENLLPLFESDPTVRSDLGPILPVGLDLVAMKYAILPIQAIASVQPLDAEAGILFYKEVKATRTRGGIKNGDVLVSPLGIPNQNISDYVTENTTDQSTVVTGDGPYTLTLGTEGLNGKKPNLIKNRLVINIDNVVKGYDEDIDGTMGRIIGYGIDSETSSINYETGELKLTLVKSADKGITGKLINITYQEELEPDSDFVPEFKYEIKGKLVQAQYDIMQSAYTVTANLVARSKLGIELNDEVASDLVDFMNQSILTKAFKALRNAAIANEQLPGHITPTWNATPDVAISSFDHRRTFTDFIDDAAVSIEQQSGRSNVTFMIIGRNARRTVRSFTSSTWENSNRPGAFYVTDLEGIPVYYAPPTMLPEDEVLFGYRGSAWYESPVVYAPWIPVTTVAAAGVQSLFNTHQGIITAYGIDVTTPQFVTRGKIISK